nr:hypothetical protein [Tanacetum cinerariifolium]
MGYEHLSITPKTESDEVTESNAENLLPIPSEYELFSITRLISNIESLKDNSTLDRMLNSFEFDNSLLDNFSPEFKTFCDHSEETRSEGDVRFLEELLIDDSILSYELSDDLEPDMIVEEISDKLNEDKCFDPGRGINVSTKIEDDDYFPFMFFIRFFLPYFIFLEVSPLLLSAESEDAIFDPGISD